MGYVSFKEYYNYIYQEYLKYKSLGIKNHITELFNYEGEIFNET